MRIELVLLSLKLYYIEYMDIAKDSDRFIQNIQQLTLVNIIPTLTFLQINPPEIKPNNKHKLGHVDQSNWQRIRCWREWSKGTLDSTRNEYLGRQI